MGLRRSVNGAVAGGVAAALWAAQQPLDKRAFRSGYDDVEILGKAVVRGDGWRPAGLAMHVANGALFGAAYAQLRRFLPGPALAQGPALAIGEHLALWPLGAVADRYHPRRGELTRLSGNRAAFWQAFYRHALFGVAMAALETHLNAAEDPEDPEPIPVSSNGHGDIRLAVSGAA